jgi:D-alanyl-D-alanine carboxypeptidase/D-alanyl-D-alanine-endopeptidase (penicillin-binding protein 4)
MAGPIHQNVRLDVRTDTARAPARLSADYTARRDTVYIRGSIGAGVADTSTWAATNPAWSAGVALAGALSRRGIPVGAVRVVRDPAGAAALRAGARELGVLQSAPLRDIVRVILQPSQNWTAEQVLKTLGAAFGTGGTWRAGIEVERRYLSDVAGIDSLAINLRDASGMSPQNLLAPDATVALLAHARSQPWGEAYRSGMAQPGVAGTTLSSRVRALDGRVFAKTGTISNVNTLSGYLVADDGREYLFTILTNGTGLPSGTTRPAIDEILLAMARFVDAR